MANMDGNFRVSVLAMTEALLLLRIMCCASVHASKCDCSRLTGHPVEVVVVVVVLLTKDL